MTQEEAIQHLKEDGFDLFHIEERPTVIIIAGCRHEPRGKRYKLEDGKLFEHVGYDGLEHKWDEEELIKEKLEAVKNGEY